MSYRKLEVDGVTYEYSIGKTHTKIRHVGAFSNTDVGIKKTVKWGEETFNDVQVRPSDLASFIKFHKLKPKK